MASGDSTGTRQPLRLGRIRGDAGRERVGGPGIMGIGVVPRALPHWI